MNNDNPVKFGTFWTHDPQDDWVYKTLFNKSEWKAMYEARPEPIFENCKECNVKPNITHSTHSIIKNGRRSLENRTRFQCPSCHYNHNWVDDYYTFDEMRKMWNTLQERKDDK